MKTVKTMLDESMRRARGAEPGGRSAVRPNLGGSWACCEECGHTEVDFDDEPRLPLHLEIELVCEDAEAFLAAAEIEDPAQRTSLSADTREVRTMSKEEAFTKSLASNAHYQAALAEAKTDEEKARVETYRSNLRARFMQSYRDESEAKARQERKAALRAEAEERIEKEQHEAAVAAEIQRLRSAAA